MEVTKEDFREMLAPLQTSIDKVAKIVEEDHDGLVALKTNFDIKKEAFEKDINNLYDKARVQEAKMWRIIIAVALISTGTGSVVTKLLGGLV